MSIDSPLRFICLLITSVISVYVGFYFLDTESAIRFVKHFGYWLILISFLGLIYYLYKLGALHWQRRACFHRRYIYAAVYIALWSFLLLASSESRFKILMDEVVLAGTAMHMHDTKQAMTVSRGLQVNGSFNNLGGFVDKRPFFYPFLVSVLHDWTGYRISQPMVLNALLVPVFLGLLFYTGQLMWRKYGGYVAVALFATVPLLAMNANSGGFDFLNLVMLLGTALTAYHFLEYPDASRMNLLIFLGVLLAQTRYESALYVVAIASVFLFYWLQVKCIRLTWVCALAPFLLVGYAAQRIVVNGYDSLWELRPGTDAPFALSNLSPNLGHAADFFFAIDKYQPNSLLLSLVFVCALVGCLILFMSQRERFTLNSGAKVFIAFAAVTTVNFFILMTYYWGQLDDIVATRIVLPFLLLQVCVVVFVGSVFKNSKRAGLLLILACSLYFVSVSKPLLAKNYLLQWSDTQAEVDYIIDTVEAAEEPNALYIAHLNLPALLTRHSALRPLDILNNSSALALHMELGTFYPVYVFYRVPNGWSETAMNTDVAEKLDALFEMRLIEEIKLNDAVNLRFAEITQLKSGSSGLGRLSEIADPTTAEAMQRFSETLP